jgi:hypothetical protein
LASCLLADFALQIPCDDVYGQHCPESSGWGVGDCINALEDKTLISEECSKFINIQQVCRADIDTHCAGKEYTSEVISCLNEWTDRSKLSEECKGVLPEKKAAPEKRTLTKEEKRKADERRKIRNKAAKMARDL